jgi:hypothetical protein
MFNKSLSESREKEISAGNVNMNWFFISFTYVFSWHLYLCALYVYNRENEASLAVLPDLFVELDGMDEVCLNNTTITCCFTWFFFVRV